MVVKGLLIWALHLLVLANIVGAQSSRTTISGATCPFPQIYDGKYMEDCFEVSGKQSCLINGSLEECVAVNNGAPTSGTRTTVDGQTCTFPFKFRSVDNYDCVNVGGMDMCMINGGLVECIDVGNSPSAGINVPTASRTNPAPTPTPAPTPAPPSPAPRVTTTGQTCEFPFKMGTQSFDDCFTVEDTEYCSVGGTIMECQPRSTNPTPTLTSTPATTPSSSSVPRKTINGQDCDKTYTYKGRGYSGCILIEETEFCEVGGILMQCEPIAGASSSPAVSPSATTSAPSSGPSRVTVDGDACEFPIIYRGSVLQDCMQLAGLQQCQIGGQWKECAPVDGTTPTPSPVPLAPQGSLVRKTVDGRTCQLPFVYYGETYSDCTIVANQEQCYFQSENSWAACAPIDDSAAPVADASTGVIRNTPIGICTFPNFFQGNLYNDCWSVAGQMVCEVNGILAECLDMDSSGASATTTPIAPTPTPTPTPTVSSIPPPSSTPTTPVGGLIRTTTDGKTCQLPFTYYGETYYDCTTVAGQEQCYFQAQNSWSVCEPLTGVAPSTGIVRNTNIGICTFPAFYRGNVYNDCWNAAGKMICEVNGIVAECLDMDASSVMVAPVASAPSPASTPTTTPTVPATPRMTVDGQQCQFPFTYRGGTFYECTNISGNFSCLIDGQWKECLDFVAEDIENAELKSTNAASNNNEGSGNSDSSGSSSSNLSAGAVAGIVIAVLFVVVLATLGVLYYLHLQRRPVTQFVKFDDPVVDGGEEIEVAHAGDQNLESEVVPQKDATPEPRAFV